MKANSFRVVALPTLVADDARRAAADGAADHQITTVESAQTAPCRHCLSWAEPGELVVLFPYQSIPAGKPYAESGPIFVHAGACTRYAASDEFPPAFRSGRAIRAYNGSERMVAAEVANGAPEEVADRLLADPAVQFLQVRSATHGCYTFKLERA